MSSFTQFCTILLLISLCSAQSTTDFFADDVGAGLVPFEPINIGQSQGIQGIDNQQDEDSIGGIFASEELIGTDTLQGFSVGGDFAVGDVEGGAFAGVFVEDVVSMIYGADGTSQVDQVQQDFQQNLLNLIN